eukprot:g7228.t1
MECERLDAMLGAGGENEESQFLRDLFQAVVLCAKASNAVPTEDEDFHYQMNTDGEYRATMESCQLRLTELLQGLLDRALPSNAMELRAQDDIVMGDSAAFEGVTDAIDALTEEVDAFLDEQADLCADDRASAGNGTDVGSNRQRALLRGSLRAASAAQRATAGGIDVVEHKPQQLFRDARASDRGRDTVFVPRLSVKPHAARQWPLNVVMRPLIGGDVDAGGGGGGGGGGGAAAAAAAAGNAARSDGRW